MPIERLADLFMGLVLIVCIILMLPFYFICLAIEAFAPQTPESEHAAYYHRYL